MNRIKSAVISVVVLYYGFFVSGSVSAQSRIDTGMLDVGGSVGVSADFDSVTDELIRDFAVGLPGGSTLRFDAGSNTKLNYGASVGYGVMPGLLVIGEVMRTRIANPELIVDVPLLPDVAIEGSASLLEVTGGVQYEPPLENARVLPFVGVSLGFARSKVGLEESGFPGLNLVNLDRSQTDFTVNYGGGARIHVSERWGFRPEFKIVHVPDETFFRAGIGVFIQFGR